MKGRVTVFVDDYVLGRMPPVCAVTGVSTTDQVKFRTNVSPLNPLWILLVFLGPLGWIVLLAIAWSSSNHLAGWLPYRHEVAHRVIEQRRMVIIGGALGTVGFLLLGGFLNAPVFVGLAAAVTIAAILSYFVSGRNEPRFELDGSRRWVTITGVHPDFVAALERRQSTDHDLSLPRL